MSIESLVCKDFIDISNYGTYFLQFCAKNQHFCKSYCKAKNDMLFCRQKEMSDMKNKKKLVANVARKTAESALRRDANRTTCVGFYQPKVPAALKRFKNVK